MADTPNSTTTENASAGPTAKVDVPNVPEALSQPAEEARCPIDDGLLVDGFCARCGYHA
jgi:hypothetical protein